MKLTLDDYLSPHFTVGEFFRSGTAIRLGINNTPDAYPNEGISTEEVIENLRACLLYTSPSPRDYAASRMPSSA